MGAGAPKAFFLVCEDFQSAVRYRRLLSWLGLWVFSAATVAPQALATPPSQRQVDAEAATVFIVLSPRMVYALKEWPRMKVAAEQAGFNVQTLRDPRVPLPEWQAAVSVADVPALEALPAADSAWAARWGLLNHSPSALVSRCDQTHPWPVLGVMPDAAWLSVLEQRKRGIPCH